VPPGYIPQPDDTMYFCGILIGLMIQILINYDYINSYITASQYFTHVNVKDADNLLSKFKKSPKNLKLLDYFWPFSFYIFLIQSIICLIMRFYFHYNYLVISLIILTPGFFLSLFALTFVKYYLHTKEDLSLAFAYRDKMLQKLEHELLYEKHRIRSEVMKKSNITDLDTLENLVQIEYKRVLEVRKNKLAYDIFRMSDNEIDPKKYQENPADEDETAIVEWLNDSTNLQILNVFFYIYYICLCCKDCPYLYERI